MTSFPLETLKEIIIDHQEQVFEASIPRRLHFESIPKKATICIGVRRSGKSTLMFQHMQKLLEEGISRQNILYLNFFDDRLHELQHAGLSVVMEAYYALYPHKKHNETLYCFFDEIQIVPNWESFIDRLMRTETCQIYITGSSADMLSKEIATQMRGRALSWELFPFSFQEYLDYKAIDYQRPLSTQKRYFIQKALEEYWQTGGFPEVLGLEKHLRIKIHQEYFNTILFRDLIERHNVSHSKAIIDLAHRLVDNIASLYSINSLTGYLKSLGHKIPKSTVSDYLEWFEDAFFLFTVKIYDASLTRTNTNPKKIYCIDHALITSTSSGILVNSGHLLENLVFMALRRTCQNIFYFKTKTSREVDFIIIKNDRSKRLIQVCETLAEPRTRTREITALTEAMEELHLTTGTIVTLYEEETLEVSCGVIEVICLWRFLLQH